MKITVNKTFIAALSKAIPMLSTKATLPILSHVLIQADDGKVTIKATDLEVGFSTEVEATVEETGGVAVPGKKFHEILKELPAEDIVLKADNKGWLHIDCGKAKFKIAYLEQNEFPKLEAVSATGKILSLACSTLAEMLGKVKHAICKDETKYNLCGVFLKGGNGGLRIAATDGSRLAVAKSKIEEEVSEPFEKGVIIPDKGVAELLKLAEDGEDGSNVVLSVEGSSCVASLGGTSLYIRLVDGEYPDYPKIIPSQDINAITMTADRPSLMSILKRVSLMGDGKHKRVSLSLTSGNLKVTAKGEGGTSEDELPVTYEGAALDVDLNPRYLIDILLDSIKKKVELRLKDNMSPLLLMDSDDRNFVSVVMPMRRLTN